MANILKRNKQFAKKITNKIEQMDKEIQKYGDTEQNIIEVSNDKKKLLQKLNQIEKILGQESKLKEEYQKANEEASAKQKIISLKSFKKQLYNEKQELLEQIDKNSYLLNPINYMNEKNKLVGQREQLQLILHSQEQGDELLIEFIENFLKCFETLIKNTNDEDEILMLIYRFRYFMLLPFDLKKSIKDIEQLQKRILEIEKKLVQKAIQKKVITDVPFEIMRHLFESRIIILEDLYYKITRNSEKYYVQIFDESVSGEKFEITQVEKTKINKKIKIFI